MNVPPFEDSIIDERLRGSFSFAPHNPGDGSVAITAMLLITQEEKKMKNPRNIEASKNDRGKGLGRYFRYSDVRI